METIEVAWFAPDTFATPVAETQNDGQHFEALATQFTASSSDPTVSTNALNVDASTRSSTQPPTVPLKQSALKTEAWRTFLNTCFHDLQEARVAQLMGEVPKEKVDEMEESLMEMEDAFKCEEEHEAAYAQENVAADGN